MSNLSDNCSICLNNNTLLINIAETDTNQVKLSNKLSQCVPEVDWSNECCICPNCIEKLEISYSFYHLCIQSFDVRKQQAFMVKIEEPEFDSKEIYDYKVNSPTNDEIKTSIKEIDCFSTTEADIVVKKDPLEDVDNVEEDTQIKTEEVCSNEIENTRKKKYPKKCDYCSKQFNRKQLLDAHIRGYHTLEKPYVCDLCQKRFITLDRLKYHKRIHTNPNSKHTGERTHICTFCGKGFYTKSDLKIHEKQHLNKREYQCTDCPKTFNTHKDLRTHRLVVHTDSSLWKFVCTFCQKRFPMKSSVDLHMRRHLGDKRFACHICDKRFVDKIVMQKHIQSHSNIRAFKCEHCQKEYKDSRVFEIHLTKIHGIGNAKIPLRVKKHFCDVCSKSFVEKNKLTRHMFSHTGEKPFNCHMCDKRFTDKSYVKQHLRTVHNVVDSGENK